MRRFGFGATNRPGFNRPGVAYGQFSNGAPKPVKRIKPREEIVPEMFTENSECPIARTTFAEDFIRERNLNRDSAQTTIDLTSD